MSSHYTTQITEVTNNSSIAAGLVQPDGSSASNAGFVLPAGQDTGTVAAGSGGVFIRQTSEPAYLFQDPDVWIMWDNGDDSILGNWWGQTPGQAIVMLTGTSQGYGGYISLTIQPQTDAAEAAERPHPTARPVTIDLEGLRARQVASGPRLVTGDLRNQDLRGIDFRGVSLAGADLRGATLFDPPAEGKANEPRNLRNFARLELTCRHTKGLRADFALAETAASILNLAEFGGKIRAIPDEKLAAVDAILAK